MLVLLPFVSFSSSWLISLPLARIAVLIFALFFSVRENQMVVFYARLNRNFKNNNFDSK